MEKEVGAADYFAIEQTAKERTRSPSKCNLINKELRGSLQVKGSVRSMTEFPILNSNFKTQYRRRIMNARSTTHPTERATVIRRIVPASAFRRLRSDMARQKQSRKALRRMRKERNDE